MSKFLLAAGALASVHAHMMTMPQRGLATSPRPVFPARAANAVNMAAFSEGDVAESLEKMCAQCMPFGFCQPTCLRVPLLAM